MDIRKIDNSISVGPQISAENLQELTNLGFKSIICNRPDNESPDQPSFNEIRIAAEKSGLNAHQIPVVPGGIKSHDIKAFNLALSEMPGPVFAYCKTGTRAAALWSLSAVSNGKDINSILKETSNAGYDLSGMLPMLEECSPAVVARSSKQI